MGWALREAPVTWVPGTECRLHIDFGGGGEGELGPGEFVLGTEPCTGDLLCTEAGASYYVIDAWRSKTRRERWHFKCERLPYGSVLPGNATWVFYYARRR